jgi:hypothetical protein
MQYHTILTILICSILCACGGNSKQSYDETLEMEVIEAEASSAHSAVSVSNAPMTRSESSGSDSYSPVSPDDPKIEKKIIRTGRLTLKTRELEDSRLRLDSLATELGGYIASESYNDQEHQRSYNISYRIPAEKFNDFLHTVESGKEKMESKTINVNDVTMQYYDISIRLENEKELEKRYLNLLNRANSVKDILEIEEKLNRNRQEIESKEGRLRYLDNQVSYSTLNIYLYQKKEIRYEPEERDGFGQRLLKSLHNGWLGFVDVILFILKLWPLWLIAGSVWWLILRLRRRRKETINNNR